MMRSLAALLAIGFLPAFSGAQGPVTRPVLDPVVTIADRSGSPLSSSLSAVTRIDAAAIARFPRATLADALRMVPGFTLVDFDGLGFDPQIMVRGFYGGGESEYVLVLVDGVPVNRLHSGTVAWDILPPLAAVEAIEVVRGSGSAMYGDAAVAGVINVITRGGARRTSRGEASVGGFGSLSAGADVALPADLRFTAGVERTAGFRDHARRSSGRAALGVSGGGPGASYAVRLESRLRDVEEPGPLLDSIAAIDRSASDPLFRFDRTTEHVHTIDATIGQRLHPSVELTGALGGELSSSEGIRTLALAPGFGDTKERVARTGRGTASVQLRSGGLGTPWEDLLVVGIDANGGTLDSRYYRFAAGPRPAYAASAGDRGELDTHAKSSRVATGLYAQYSVEPSSAFRFSVAGRFDEIRDKLDPVVPDGEQGNRTAHSAFTPKAGVSLRYMSSGAGSGRLFISGTSSFKMPSLDQLYDQRNIPVPSPPFQIRTSNPELRPQRGSGIEGGVYHDLVSPDVGVARLSLAVYEMSMRDEIDFDVTKFKYVNIGRSRHRGIELGATAEGARSSAFVAYTLQDARSRSGASAGKRLKAIPLHTVSAGATVSLLRRLDPLALSVSARHARGAYLDDDNTRPLEAHAIADLRLSYAVSGYTLFAEARNVLDAKNNSTGFMDPGGSGKAYLYPAAGRTLAVGASLNR